MGLDMYLTKRTYVKNWDHMALEERHQVTVLKAGKPVEHIRPERIREIIEQMAYWRKANQIHHWFVQNVQGGNDECQDSYVSREQLLELLNLTVKVLADRTLAKTLLPTESGFFFGGTDYDDGYFSDLEDTKAQLTAILEEPDEGELYYSASW